MNDHFNLYPWYERIPKERLRLIIRNACIVATRYWQDKPVYLLVGNLFGADLGLDHARILAEGPFVRRERQIELTHLRVREALGDAREAFQIAEANQLRDRVYAAIHEGDVWTWSVARPEG